MKEPGRESVTAVYQQEAAADMRQAAALMAEKIKRAVAVGSPPDSSSSRGEALIRPRIRTTSIPPLLWLSGQTDSVRTYWSDRENKFEMAGVGAADLLGTDSEPGYQEVFTQLRRHLDLSPYDTRYYGGFKFDPTRPPDRRWGRFGQFLFVLPRFELCRSGHVTSLVANVFPEKDRENLETILAQLDRIACDNDSLFASIPGIISRIDAPQRSRWVDIVQSALTDLENNLFEKIVLARKTTLELSHELDPVALLYGLTDGAANCYRFCLQPDAQLAFIGASPERLYCRMGRSIRCEAVAGTRPRGETREQDEARGKELLGSEKDIREHRFVSRSIMDTFRQLCESSPNGNDAPISLLKLARVQHLISRFESSLKDGISDSEILCSLHPTAAVGGYPKDAALSEISNLESFDRGWYAGPVGWVGHDAAEFAVAIRSGLVAGNRLELYSGAGIVGGSTPDDEWNEIEKKMSVFLKALAG